MPFLRFVPCPRKCSLTFGARDNRLLFRVGAERVASLRDRGVDVLYSRSTEVRRDVVCEVEGRLHLVRLHERSCTRTSEDGESLHAHLARGDDRVACPALKTHEHGAQASQRIPLGFGGNLCERLHAFLQVILRRRFALGGAVRARGDDAGGVLNDAFGPSFLWCTSSPSGSPSAAKSTADVSKGARRAMTKRMPGSITNSL